MQLDRNKQSILIEGVKYHKKDFNSHNLPLFSHHSAFHHELYLFLKEWFDDTETIQLKTSGSTGAPKTIEASKNRMMQSAKLTCTFIDLNPKDKALLCLPIEYIAGKMMVVRALVAGLDLYPVIPCGNPLKNIRTIEFDFVAMVPLQVYNSLQTEEEKNKLKSIKALIIGGSSLDLQIENELKTFPNKIFVTYGMTETLSHIALRKINGTDASPSYMPFSSVSISLKDDCLVINAPLVNEDTLYTNDLAKIYPDGSFEILGRKDNTINTGGIKIQVEKLEQKLSSVIQSSFAISSFPDPKFGEVIILVCTKHIDEKLLENILDDIEKPKHILLIDSVPLTYSSKVDRKALKKLVREKLG